jgi:hypothetical protein
MPHENLPWALKHKEHKNGDAIYDNVLTQRVHTRRAGPPEDRTQLCNVLLE